MSIRRRINTYIVDIWVTNNSNYEGMAGSLRWAIAQASNTEHTYIKVAHEFIDLAGVGRNMYVAGTRVQNNVGSVVKDITIDFSYTNVVFGTGGGFGGSNNILNPTFKLQNMVVENQDFGTPTSALFGGMVNYTNCRFENLVSNFLYFEYTITSTTTNCIFRNVVRTGGVVFYFVNGTHTVDNCIFDNTIGGYVYVGSPTINYSRCYINVSANFVKGGGINQAFNFSQCYIRNSGTSPTVALAQNNFGDVTNCTFVNMRISLSSAKSNSIRHCTQIYTLPIAPNTILNGVNTTMAHTIENNIFISPNSNNVFSPALTSLTESNNLYLCANVNELFPNSTTMEQPHLLQR